MMTRAIDLTTNPPLRLVVPDDAPTIDEARSRRAVENENRRAARLAYDKDEDVRRLLAARTSHSLEGGRAAILSPNQRRHLVQHGQRMGLRPFEANLIISVVQDGARRGAPISSPDVQRSLEVIPGPSTADAWNDPWTWARLWLAAAALGGLMLIVLVDWFVAL